MNAIAAIIAERIGPGDPTPNDLAFAHLIAFAARDLQFIVERLKKF